MLTSRFSLFQLRILALIALLGGLPHLAWAGMPKGDMPGLFAILALLALAFLSPPIVALVRLLRGRPSPTFGVVLVLYGLLVARLFSTDSQIGPGQVVGIACLLLGVAHFLVKPATPYDSPTATVGAPEVADRPEPPEDAL